ncbi:hypothetical protein E8E12_000579 [Didymella heteroderae]|uniref:Uncharacterized protein n=1 Tax=Didymella heteroderae TaxID=1769908 RepID=A0A9P4WTU7_9PLEO|nr:hypothetical protein E8E12_000579 [Didymella heteroderae]
MTELSKGKQQPGPSKLRNVRRPPDSDTVILETQLEADGNGVEENDLEIDPESLAILATHSVKKSAASTVMSSQIHAAPSQTFLLTRPPSAKTEEPRFLGRQAFHKTPPEEDARAVKSIVHPTHPDIAIPSIEPLTKDVPPEAAGTTPVPSSWLQTLTVERVTETPPITAEPRKDEGQEQQKHEKSVHVGTLHTEPVQPAPSIIPTKPQIDVQSSTQATPATKKKRTKAKKVKIALFREPLQPLLPWSGPSSGLSNTQSTAASLTSDTAIEPKVGADRPQQSVGDLAVKARPGETFITDGPLEVEQAPLALPVAAATSPPAADDYHTESSAHAEQIEYAQPCLVTDANAEQPVRIPDDFTSIRDPSMPTPRESLDQRPQAQRHHVMKSRAMALRVKAWEGERSDFQTTITKQMETIAEQRMKLEISKERFAKLTDKLKSSQKFVSGLQKDHEKLQKDTVILKEQNKRVLQDKIAQILKEKEELQAGLEGMVNSCKKSQRSMLKTMHEVQLRYVTALSRENGLKSRIEERMAMYEEEKQKRTELEQRLLPAVESMQRHLSEGSTTLVEKISSLRASIASLAAENDRDSTAQELSLTLQKLQSLPLLTSNDVRKAEGMLRYLHERTDAGFKLIAKDSQSDQFPIEDIRSSIRDEMQELQAEIVRNNQAIADDQLAREANQLLVTEVETEKQANQQLEEIVVSLRQSEATLKSRIKNLESERDELHTMDEEHQVQQRKSGERIAELQAQLGKVNEDLCKSNAIIRGHERQHLEERVTFCKYRTDTLTYLANLREHMRQITNEKKSNTRECDALKQEAAKLKAQLESEQTKANQLLAKISQQDCAMRVIEQENNDAVEKEGRTRNLLNSVKDSNRALETKNRQICTEIEELRTELHTSKDAEQQLTSQCSGLQRQVKILQDAKTVGDEQLRQVQHDSESRLQQAEAVYTASLDDLKSSLKLSEDTREELQAKTRQMETRLKEQIEHHEQKFNAKFEDLVTQSQQEQEKLKAKHQQEMKRCEQEAAAKISNQALERKNEADAWVAKMVAETERRLEEAGLSTSRTLVPATQQYEQNGVSSSQQSRSGRTRKKVDRQTNSVTVVVSSSNGRSNTAEGPPIIDATAVSDRRREGFDNRIGCLKEEHGSRSGSQVRPQEQEMQFSVLDPASETVPETQAFEHGQGVAAQFEIIESQIAASDNISHNDNLTDLSTMSSEDLFEMLMDIHPTSQQRRQTPKHVSSPNGELRTPEQSDHDRTPDAHFTNSQGRPKSRANTASRMMPLPNHDGQLQRTHADQSSGRVSQVRAERSFTEDDNDSPGFMHPNSAIAKRTYGHRSGHDAGTGQKRKTTDISDDSGSFRKLRTLAQVSTSSISKSYVSYKPTSTNTPAEKNGNLSPSSVIGRRSRYQQSSAPGSQGATPRLSSTRNTRSKTGNRGNRFDDRFADELERR